MRLLPKHLLLSVIPTLVTLAAVLFVTRGLILDRLLLRIEENAKREAERAAESTEMRLDGILARLRVVERRLPDASPEEIRTALWAERAAATELLSLHRIDGEGTILGTDGMEAQVVLQAADSGRADEVIERDGVRLVLLVARGERATLVAAISAAELIRGLSRLHVGARGFALLADREGRLLAGARPSDSTAELEKGLASAGEQTAWIELGGEAHLFLGRSLPMLDWRLGIVLPREELIADVKSVRSVTLSMIVAAMILLTLSAVLVSRSLARPMEELRALTERLGGGDLSARAELRSTDEIGELARSFNQMADRLNRVIAESKSLVESLPHPIFVHASGRFLYLNPAARALVGEEEAVGRSIDFFAADGSKGDLRSVMEEASPARVVRRDGLALELEAVGLDVTFDRSPARMVLVDDVTERRHFEEQVNHTQKLESLGLVAGGIAHDFNNMLTAIMGNNELVLLDTPPDSPMFGPLEHVRRATDKAAGLCRQMLAYAGRGQFVLASFDLNRAVAEIGELLQASIMKKATLIMELDPQPLPIEADVAQIQQVVMNLITNASEALEERPGTITVRTGVIELDGSTMLRTLEGLPKGTYAMLEVTDTGVGMSEQVKQRIFDPFFTTKMTGRGLGLAGVLGIVRAHLGDISVESEPGRGTRFRVYFPKAEHAITEREAEPIDETPYYGTGTVLVADDEAPVLQLTRRILSRYGFEVACAADGKQALDLFREKRGEIVCALLDLTMPVLSGREVLDRIRSIDPNVPVVLMSGYEDGSDDLVNSGESVPFVAKPFRVSALIGAIRNATDLRTLRLG